MRSKRRVFRKLNSGFILCISTIVMLNFMGICYGAWDGSINIKTSIAMGNLEPYFDVDGTKIVGNDKGQLELELSNNGRTLTISGWCYPTFNENVTVEIKNRGTLPVVLNGIDRIEEDEIIMQLGTLSEKQMKRFPKSERNNFYNKTFITSDDAENIEIHIRADSENEKKSKSPGKDKESDSIENEKNENVKVIEEHTFIYDLQFEQGL